MPVQLLEPVTVTVYVPLRIEAALSKVNEAAVDVKLLEPLQLYVSGLPLTGVADTVRLLFMQIGPFEVIVAVGAGLQ